MPDHSREPAENQFNPDSGEDHPLTLRAACEQKDVGSVSVESRSEINKQEPHLVHVAAEMFAGETVAEFVDRAENHQKNREHPDVVRALVGEIVERGSVLLHARPITGKQVAGDDEYEQREHNEAGREHPAQVGIELGKSLVGVPSLEAHIEET